MKKFLKFFSVALLLFSIFYFTLVVYYTQNGIIIGTNVVKVSNQELKVVDMTRSSYGRLMGLEIGDKIVEINGHKPNKENIYGSYLAKVRQLKVERNDKLIKLDNFEFIYLDSPYSFFSYIVPGIFYLLSLICIFYIFRVNLKKDSISAYILICFLLCISIAYLSAGGVTRGYSVNRYINLYTFLAVPVLYLNFLHQYFKELNVKFSRGIYILILYNLPLVNIICELFEKHIKYDVITSLNLLTFLFEMMVVYVCLILYQIKHRKKDFAYLLKVLLVSNTIAFLPFTLLYIVPLVIFGQYVYSAVITAPFLLLIPLALVYQFVVNKIYNIDFLLGRLRYYCLLAVIPSIGIVWVFVVFMNKNRDFNTFQITLFVFLIMLSVFYFKEVLDYKFRLKRFSEKYNYQDSIFKYTQLIKSVSVLNQVFTHLKATILDVLPVSKAYIFEISSGGEIVYFDKQSTEPNWYPYKDKFEKVNSEIGKIIEINQGFLMKIGERGTSSYVLLCLSSINTPRLTMDETSWLKTLSFYTSVSMENVLQIEELMDHLQNLKQQGSNPVWLKKLMFTIEEKQRSDLARDLHDSVLQDLISLKRQCELFLADFKKEEPCQLEVQDKLHQMNEQMSDVILMTRETCHELRPQLLYDLGLVKAVSKLAAQQQERAPFHIRLNTGRFTAALDLDTQLNLYRIIQEFLSNAMKHSQANEVLIMLISIQNKVILHYEDDGVGCNQEEGGGQSMSMGLSGIKERVRALDGRMKIDTSEGNGFKVDIEMEL
ncbi:sensor histidine kinase [Bacillus velezensis]|uniref:sensor histidine kinase n=1 Tax=Bacillus velezensis TaxID=492670 RepID=UPI00059D4542|nr:histidine kinase [Bacillus velezensis]AQP98262.1 histidine kinase [Bacillus sp. 275]MCM3447856.1 histidine kinase [Bacillus velezensis]MCY7442282.1 histidine kinase [Bacillus velezensis]OAL86220.1 histidine kinase [Bacillus velezensis]QNQ52094.1 histidine kinase [Bacillus velezensis]